MPQVVFVSNAGYLIEVDVWQVIAVIEVLAIFDRISFEVYQVLVFLLSTEEQKKILILIYQKFGFYS